MSPPDRPKGAYRRAQHQGTPVRAAQRPSRWAALALAAAAGPLQAQGLEVAAQAQLSLVAAQHADADTTPNTWLASARLGLARQDALANGWQRRLSATALLRTRSGHCPSTVCADAPDDDNAHADAALLASLWHYAWGRFTLGRGPSLLAEQAERSSPFGNATIGSDRCAPQLAAACQQYRSFSVTYEAPTLGPWTPAAQLAFKDGKTELALRSALQLGAGQAWVSVVGDSRHGWQLPLGLSLPVDRWRLLASHTNGHTADGPARHRLLGLTTPALGGELRAQWSQRRLPAHEAQPAEASTKLAVGLHWALSPQWSPYIDLATVRRDDGHRWRGLDVGARWVW